MSLLFPFLKQPKPRQFDHKPIYYDKLKEEREKRYERIKNEMNMAEEPSQTPQHDFEKDIRGSFRKAVPGGSSREKMQKFSRIMIIVCIVMLLIVLFMYFRISSLI